MTMTTSKIADELLAKHSNSTQPSSKTLCAVVTAAVEVLRAEGLEPSPLAIFAATMSSLDRPQGYSTPEVATALCTVLNACLGRLPDALIRSKFIDCSKVVMTVMAHQHEEAGVMRVAVDALGQITAAMDPADWPSAAGPFNRLLGISLDARPKVRRAAHSAVAAALTAIRESPAIEPASQALLKVSQQILPGPEAALRANNSAAAKKRQEADAIMQKAVTDATHLLNLLRICLPLLSGPVASQVAVLLPKLFPLQHPMLTRQAADTLTAMCGSGSVAVSAKALAALLEAVLDAEAAWVSRDANAILSLIRLVDNGFSRLHRLDAHRAAAQLDEAFGRLVAQFSAAQENVRLAAAQALKGLARECCDYAAAHPSELETAVAVLEGALGAAHRESWPLALSVTEELLRGWKAENVAAVEDILVRLGDIWGSAAEALAAGEDDKDGAAVGKAAGAALGAAIASLGPAAVLTVLPLNLEVAESGKARTWLLPLLRQHTQNASLDFWATHLLPVARIMVQKAATLPGGGPQGLLALQLRALEAQIWTMLPSFCQWPIDMADAFRQHAQDIGKAFLNREDLRPPICTALERLCMQNRAALKIFGGAEELGFSNPTRDDLDNDNDDELSAEPELIVPLHYTADVAKRNLACLRQFSKNWMPLLFNAFVAAPAGGRSHLGRAISAYASIADAALLDTFFKTIIKKLIEVTQDAKTGERGPGSVKEGGDTPSEQRCTFMELALRISPGLPPAAVNVLLQASVPALQEKDQAVQKRAYRLLAYILEERKDFVGGNFQEVLDALLLGVASSFSAAKRYRLRCLQAATLILQSPDAPEIAAADEEMAALPQSGRQKQVIAMLVSEIVLCTKEVNKRTRAAAYELLVGLAQAMHQASPPKTEMDLDHSMGEEGEDGKGGLHTLFTMILGGLVGATPHMVSASVMALARLLYEFASLLEAAAPQLLPVVLSLLRSKSREIIKSVLGFIKVCVSRLPIEMLERHLKGILEGILLWSEDSKNKFKLKVRVILERLVRRVGHDAVAQHMPEAHRKLLTHIRKEQLRKHRTRESEAGSQMDVEEAALTKSKAGKSSRAKTAWAASEAFSSDDEDAVPGASSRKSRAASKWGDGKSAKRSGTVPASKKGPARQLALGNSDEPLDLLDPSTSRAMLQTAAGRNREPEEPEFAMEGGRMIINEEDAPSRGKGKRKRGGGVGDAESDDSDFDDLHHIAGATAALRLGGRAASTAGGRSVGGKSFAGKSSFTGRSTGGRSSKTARKGKEHTGERFAASKGTGGDKQGRSKVEPYAYWPLDRKMLNRRQSKKVQAKKGLASVVHTVKAGGCKGNKAKRQKRS